MVNLRDKILKPIKIPGNVNRQIGNRPAILLTNNLVHPEQPAARNQKLLKI